MVSLRVCMNLGIAGVPACFQRYFVLYWERNGNVHCNPERSRAGTRCGGLTRGSDRVVRVEADGER